MKLPASLVALTSLVVVSLMAAAIVLSSSSSAFVRIAHAPSSSSTSRQLTTVTVAALKKTCELPTNAVPTFWLARNPTGERMYGPYNCSHAWTPWGKTWAMLRAYRRGGLEGVHWKYTDNKNDPDCLDGWTYYDKSGKHEIGVVWGRTTFLASDRRWCALPHYRPGIEGKQFAFCKCTDMAA